MIKEENWKGKGKLSIILTDDGMIRDLNCRFLKRDWATDVIAFPFGEEEKGLWGEIYISEERARDQALIYDVSFEEELTRLIIHGILHLLGYQDKSEELKKKMEIKENHYLRYIKKQIGKDSIGS